MKTSQSGLSTLVIVIIAVVVLGIGGYLYVQNTKTGGEAMKKTGKGSAFSSVKDILSKSLSVKCEYPDDQGNTVTTYMKAGAVRVVGSAGASQIQGAGMMLMKDNKIYIWDETTKQGTVFSVEADAMEKAQEDAMETGEGNKKEDFIKGLEQYKDYCKAEAVSDSLFKVPSDVNFVDLEQQMQNTGADQMMQQYQQPSQ